MTVLALAALAAVAIPAQARPRAARTTRGTDAARRVAVKPINMARLGSAGPASPLANWTTEAPMVQGVQENGGGAFSKGKLYVPGGFIEFTTPTLYDHMQIYSPGSNSWAADPDPMPATTTTGWADAAVCADTSGKIHVVNGVDGAFLYASQQVFDPTAPAGSKWSFLALPALSDGTTFFSQDSGCAFVGGKMYLFGGYGVVGTGSAAVQKITWVYDPTTDTWSDTGKLMKTARFWHGYTSIQTIILAAGGTNNLTTFAALANTERFSPTGGWVAMANLPQGRLAPGMGVLGSTVDVFGGGTGSGSFTLLTSTVGCTASTCGSSWTDQNKNLNVAKWFFGWGSGFGRLLAAGGGIAGGATTADTELTQ